MIRGLGLLIVVAAPLLLVQCTHAGSPGNAAVATGGEASTGAAARSGPSIDGTYRLAFRELPDGTRQVPPTVDGLMTFAGGYRGVNIMEHNARGNVVTLASVSRYTLADSLYTEHMRYHMATGLTESENGGFKANLDGSSAVTVGADASISFNLPLDGPRVIFTGDSMTARLGRILTDHWVKVKSTK
jgi:hypothetical protein